MQDDGASPPVDGASRDARAADAQLDAATAAYRATVLADAPLAYYRLDLGAGGLVKDELGAHDGHVKGALTLVDGAIAGDPSHAAIFDGASYVVIGDVLPFDGTASYTLEVWAQRSPRTAIRCAWSRRTSRATALGASRGGIYGFFRGALDEIAIYGKALAPERIRAHHTVGVGQ